MNRRRGVGRTGRGPRAGRVCVMNKGDMANEAGFGGCRSVVARCRRRRGAAGRRSSRRRTVDEGATARTRARCRPMFKGEKPYDQAAVDAALAQFEDTAKKLPTLFPGKHQGPEAGGRLQRLAEDLGRQGRLRCQDRELCQGGERSQGQDQGSRHAEGEFSRDRQGMRRLPRDLSASRTELIAVSRNETGRVLEAPALYLSVAVP